MLPNTSGPRAAFRAGLGIVPSQRSPQSAVTDAAQVFSAPLGDDTAEARGRSAGYAAGFAAGWAAGARQAALAAEAVAADVAARRHAEEEERRAAVAQVMIALEQSVHAARARTAPVLAAAEQQVHAAAIELAEAIIGCELSDAATSARAAITRVLATPLSEGVTTIKLSPRDLSVTRAEGFGETPAGIEFVSDPALAPGDVIATHADGFIDGRISAALDRARAALADEATP